MCEFDQESFERCATCGRRYRTGQDFLWCPDCKLSWCCRCADHGYRVTKIAPGCVGRAALKVIALWKLCSERLRR